MARPWPGARELLVGEVLGPDSVDPAGAHAVGHQRDQVVPHLPPAADPQAGAGPERVDAVPEEQLGAIERAKTGQVPLVQ